MPISLMTKTLRDGNLHILYGLEHLKVKYVLTNDPPVYLAPAKATEVEIEEAIVA